MTTRLISLGDAEPGMTLAAPLCDNAGNILLAAGTELSGDLLASLKRRGVNQLQVVRKETLSEAQLAQRRDELTARIDFLFRHGGNNPLMGELRTVVLDYRLEELQ